MGELFELLNAYRVPAQHLTSVLLAVAIWRCGGGPERWMIGVFLATMVVPIYVGQLFGLTAIDLGPYAPTIVTSDLVAAVMFVVIAINANRNYPLWIAGFQLVAVVAHLVKALIPDVSTLAYAILVIGPSYCQLLFLIGGFLRHIERQSRFGPYREWRLGVSDAQWWRA